MENLSIKQILKIATILVPDVDWKVISTKYVGKDNICMEIIDEIPPPYMDILQIFLTSEGYSGLYVTKYTFDEYQLTHEEVSNAIAQVTNLD